MSSFTFNFIWPMIASVFLLFLSFHFRLNFFCNCRGELFLAVSFTLKRLVGNEVIGNLTDFSQRSNLRKGQCWRKHWSRRLMHFHDIKSSMPLQVQIFFLHHRYLRNGKYKDSLQLRNELTLFDILIFEEKLKTIKQIYSLA